MIDLVQIANVETQIREFTPEGVQSIDALIAYGMELTAHLSFTGEQMSIAKKKWRDAQARGYEAFVFSRLANGVEVKPMMAKDYVAAKSGEEESVYERIERCHRTIVHTMDMLRSALSALKEEYKVSSYSSSIQQ